MKKVLMLPARNLVVPFSWSAAAGSKPLLKHSSAKPRISRMLIFGILASTILSLRPQAQPGSPSPAGGLFRLVDLTKRLRMALCSLLGR